MDNLASAILYIYVVYIQIQMYLLLKPFLKYDFYILSVILFRVFDLFRLFDNLQKSPMP